MSNLKAQTTTIPHIIRWLAELPLQADDAELPVSGLSNLSGMSEI